MHRWLPLFLVVFFAFADAGSEAGPIRYQEIPAEATGYVHVDFTELLKSQIWKQTIRPRDEKWLADHFGRDWDVTAYTLPTDGPDALVLLWHFPGHPDRPGVNARIEQLLEQSLPPGPDDAGYPGFATSRPAPAGASARDTPVQMTIGKHTVYYLPVGLVYLLTASPLEADARSHGPARVPATAPVRNSSIGPMIFLSGPRARLMDFGPVYVAFADPDLIVMSEDLPYITRALDVLDGRRPSLATSDPDRLNLAAKPGVIVQGAGLSAAPAGHAQPASAPVITARAVKIDFGENGQRELFCDAIFEDATPLKKGGDPAKELKDVVDGIKAFLGLAHPGTEQLFDPVIVNVLADPATPKSTGKMLEVHWSWPTAKIPLLKQLLGHLTTAPPPATRPGEEQGTPQGLGSP